MIPRANIVAWRQVAPWVSDAQVEHDLILSRAITALYQEPAISAKAAFRGGTALHKLHFNPARRYSEDIDLVQVAAEPIGPLLDAIQGVLNAFLGKPRRTQSEGGASLIYRVDSEGPLLVPLRIKVELNTREHFSTLGWVERPFRVSSRWFEGECRITTYSLEELLGTKLRALYQRRKGRDLFDLWLGLTEAHAAADRVVQTFQHYMAFNNLRVSRGDFQANLAAKMAHPQFQRDILPLLAADTQYDAQAAYEIVSRQLLERLDP